MNTSQSKNKYKKFTALAKIGVLAVLFILVFSAAFLGFVKSENSNISYAAVPVPTSASNGGIVCQIENPYSSGNILSSSDWIRDGSTSSSFNIYWSNDSGNGWGNSKNGSTNDRAHYFLNVNLGQDIITALRNNVKIGVKMEAYKSGSGSADWGTISIYSTMPTNINSYVGRRNSWGSNDFYWDSHHPNTMAAAHGTSNSNEWSETNGGWLSCGGSGTYIPQNSSSVVLGFHMVAAGGWGIQWDNIKITLYYQSITANITSGSNGRVENGGTKTFNATTDSYNNVKAIANPGYKFVGWHDGTSIVDTNPNRIFTGANTKPGATYTAQFAMPTYSGGNGSSGNPFILAKREDFDDLSMVIGYGMPYEGTYFKVVPDSSNGQTAYASGGRTINMLNTNFIPIGASNLTKFMGIVDGNGCTISNLKVEGASHMGLFGYVDGNGTAITIGTTTYNNISIYNLTINSSCSIKANGPYAGVIAELTGNAGLYNITNYAPISSTGNGADGNYVGGIVGIMHSTSKIINCTNYATVSSTNYVGGIVGYAGSVSSGAIIQGCVNSGTVTGSGDSIGGILGILYNSGAQITIKDCTNKGAIRSTGGVNVGGIVGYLIEQAGRLTLEGVIRNEGAVGNASYRRNYTGGIIGSVGDTSTSYAVGKLTISTSVATTLTNTGTIYGGDYTGGIAGFTKYNIFNAINSGGVNGYSNVGGIVGYAPAFGAANDLIIKDSKNSGNVTGTSTNIGGIIGFLERRNNPYTSTLGGNITNTGKIYGNIAVGGIVGQLTNANLTGTITNGTAGNNNSATLFIEGTGSYVGGIIGRSGGGAITDAAASVVNHYRVKGGNRVGGIAGYWNWGGLSNVTFTNNGKIESSGDYAGGIWGHIENANTFNNATYINNATAVVSGASYVGGIGGFTDNNNVWSFIGKNYASVTATGSYAGGILGDLNIVSPGALTVNGSVNEGAVSGVSYVGGIAGRVRGAASNTVIKASENKGTVSGGTRIGGIVGDSICRVENCVNIGRISATGNYVGGIAGYTSAEIKNSVNGNSGSYSGTTVMEVGRVTGGSYVGGIVGQATVAINTCFALGNVSGSSNVGVLVGYGSANNSWGFYFGTSLPAVYSTIGKTAVFSGSPAFAGINDIRPYSSDTRKEWSDATTTAFDNWRLINQKSISSGYLLSVSDAQTSGGSFVKPDVLTTSVNGTNINVTAFKFNAANTSLASNKNVFIEIRQFKGSALIDGSATAVYNGAARTPAITEPSVPSGYAHAYTYSYINSVGTYTYNTPTSNLSVKNAGKYTINDTVSAVVNGVSTTLGTTLNGYKVEITTYGLEVAINNGFTNSYVYNAEYQGLTSATITLLGSDKNSETINKILECKIGNVLVSNGGTTDARYSFNCVNVGTYSVKFKLIAGNDIADNYKFNLKSGAGITMGDNAANVGYKSMTFAWGITPYKLSYSGNQAIQFTLTEGTLASGWNSYEFNTKDQGLGKLFIMLLWGDNLDILYLADFFEITLTWVGADANSSRLTMNDYGEVEAENLQKNAGAYTLSIKLVSSSPLANINNYVFDTVLANHKDMISGVGGSVNSTNGITVTEKELKVSWEITKYNLSSSQVRYDGYSTGYDANNTKYINGNETPANGFVWYAGKDTVKDKAPAGGKTLFAIYNYGKAQTAFTDYLIKEGANIQNNTRLKMFINNDTTLNYLNLLVADGGAIELAVSSYPANKNGLPYATFTFTVTESNNYASGTLNLTAYIMGGDFGVSVGASGDWGSEANPYYISNWAHLFRLSRIVNGDTPWDSVSGKGYTAQSIGSTATNATFAGSHFLLGANLTVNNGVPARADNVGNTAYYFIPIGDASKPFSGTFNGGGNTIALNLNLSSSDTVGLFGYLSNAIIRNITLSGTLAGRDTVGALAGLAAGCTFTGITYSAAVTGRNNVGGLIGEASGCTLDNISGTASANVTGSEKTGGLIGNTTNCNLTNISNAGATVKGTNNVGGYIGYATGGGSVKGAEGNPIINRSTVIGTGTNTGGIVGKAEIFELNYVENNGIINGATNTGGIAGYTQYLVSNTRNTANISGSNSVGGIVGYAHKSTSTSTTIKDGHNGGSITGTGDSVGGIVGKLQDSRLAGTATNGIVGDTHVISGSGNQVGGIAGFMYGGSSNNATVVNYMKVTGASRVGGIAGELNWGSLSGNAGGTDTKSVTNYGAVTGTGEYVGGILGIHIYYGALTGNFTNNGAVNGVSKVGGILGGAEATTSQYFLTESFGGTNSGTVTSSGSNAYAGGIAGYLNLTNAGNTITLNGSVNKGTVTANNSGKYVGGIVGYVNSTSLDKLILSGSFANENSVIGGDFVGGIAGRIGGATLSSLTEKGTKISTGAGGQITVRGASYVGGIIGNADNSNLQINLPEVKTAVTASGGYVGGLFGRAVGTGWTNSYDEAKLYGIMPSLGSLDADNNLIIIDSTINATISGTFGGISDGGTQIAAIGGLAGWLGGMAIYATSGWKTTSAITVNNGNYVGGIIGMLEKGGALIGGSVQTDGDKYDFKNIKTITANSSSYVGGIIGCIKAGAGVMFSTSVTDTFYLGFNVYDDNGFTDVKNSIFRNEATVSGVSYVGGIVGGTDYDAVANASAGEPAAGEPAAGGLYSRVNATLQNIANITGSGDYVGGFIGETGINCAFYSDTTDTHNGISGGTQITIKGRDYVGGFVGKQSDGRHMFNLAYSTAQINGRNYVGGLIGYMISGRISGSFVSNPDGKKIDVNTNIVNGTGNYVGGIVGWADGGTIGSSYVQGFKFDGGNVTNTRGGIAGYAHASGVTMTDTGSYYLATNPTYGTTSASDFGKYVIIDKDIANLATFNELRVMTGAIQAANLNTADYAASFDGLKPQALSLSIKVSSGANLGVNKQLAFYDVSGYDETTSNKIAMMNSSDFLYMRWTVAQESFSICKTTIEFQTIPIPAGYPGAFDEAKWREDWSNRYLRPNNDTRYNPTFAVGYPKISGSYPTYVFTAKGEILYTPAIRADGTDNTADTVKIGVFDVTFTTGSSEANPTPIRTQSEWNTFAYNVRNSDVSFSRGRYFKLTDDCEDIVVNLSNLAGDVNDGEGDSLNNPNKGYFCGTFDGNGKTIKLDIYRSQSDTASTSRLSLFPNAANATFKNLTLDGRLETRTNNSGYGYDAAGFVGKPFGNLTFNNCTNKANITAQRLASGIVGYTRNFTITMVGCVNSGNITTTDGLSWKNDKLAYEYSWGTGGLIAYVSSNTTIESCINTGNVTGGVNVGGLVGKSMTAITLKNCANSGAIRATAINPDSGKRGLNVWSNVGGLIGEVGRDGYVNAYACYNSGRIWAQGNVAGGLFGILGTIPGEEKPHSAQTNNRSKIYYCYNVGDVSVGGDSPQGGETIGSTGHKFTGTNAGGLIGVALDLDIAYCYNVGDITNYGCVGYLGSWQTRAAGLIGEKSGTRNLNMRNCYTTGRIYIEEGGSNCRYGAGVIGYIEDTKQGNTTYIDNGTTFSLQNQVKYAGSYYTWNNKGGGSSDWIRNGTVVGSISDLTGVYDYRDNKIMVKGPNADANDAVRKAFGESSAETLIDSAGNYRSADSLANGTLPGWVIGLGCLPQLAVFAIDTKSELSMLSVGYGKNQYGNFVIQTAGDEFSPYVIKDGIDLMLFSALVDAQRGSSYWRGAHKYIQFANGENNIAGAITQFINMPTGESDWDYAYRDPKNSYNFGKNKHIVYRSGAKGIDPNSSKAVTYGYWTKDNYYFNNSGFVSGATFAHTNFYPIGMYGVNNYFAGSIDGGYVYNGQPQRTAIRNINVKYVGTHTPTSATNPKYTAAGLFGRTENAVIKNIGLSGDVKGYTTNTYADNGLYVGGFVGFSGGSTVFENLLAGTLAGVFDNSAHKLNVTAAIYGTGTADALPDGSVGGIVGRLSTNVYSSDHYNYGHPGAYSQLVDCTSENVTVTGYKNSVGGIFGNAQGARATTIYLYNCRVLNADIGVIRNSDGTGGSGTSTGKNYNVGTYIGGIGGSSIDGKVNLNGITDNYNGGVTLVFNKCSVGNGSTTPTTATNAKVKIKGESVVGGIVSAATGDTSLIDCAVYGDVYINKSAQGTNDLSGNHPRYGSAMGGMIGYVDGKCVISGTTVFAGLLEIPSTNSAQIIRNFGGIVGFMGNGATLKDIIKVSGKINIAYGAFTKSPENIGGVTGAASRVVFDGDYQIAPEINAPSSINVGGFIGINEGECNVLAHDVVINIGRLETNSGTTGAIIGKSYVGGFIGYNVDTLNIGAKSYEGEIYSGSVTIINYASVDGKSRVGGIVGSNGVMDGSAPAYVNIYSGAKIYNGDKLIAGSGKIGAGSYSQGIFTTTEANANMYFGGLIGTNKAGAFITIEAGSELVNDGQVGISTYQKGSNEYGNLYYVGGILGANAGLFAASGTIKNGDSGNVYGYRYIGGSIGVLDSGNLDGNFQNLGTVNGTKNVGGVIGEMRRNASVSGNASLSNNGRVEAKEDVVGGVISAFYGEIKGASATNPVEFENGGTVNGRNYVGGIIAILTGSVENASFINSGTVSAGGIAAVGGVIGVIADSYDSNLSKPAKITNTHFEYVAKNKAAGGAEDGPGTGEIEEIASILTAGYGDISGAVTAHIGVGGVIGVINAKDNIKSATDWNSNTFYVNGNVNAANADNVGGAVGKIDGVYVHISNMLAYQNEVIGKNNVGGIIGYNGSSNSSDGEGASVAYCYNVRGKVIGGTNVGGIVGGFSSVTKPNVYSSYWIVEFLNSQLAQASGDNLNTANMDKHVVSDIPTHVILEGEEGYVSFEDLGYTDTQDFTTYLELYKQYKVRQYNANKPSGETCSADDLEELDGQWVFYTPAAGQTIYSTGNDNTGQFFAYASDANKYSSQNIGIKHPASGEFTDLDFWKYIATAYSNSEREMHEIGGNPIANVTSALVFGNGTLTTNHFYATGKAGSNGYYLSIVDSEKDAAKKCAVNYSGDTFFMNANGVSSGNIIMFYKQVSLTKTLTYNGYERYTPIKNKELTPIIKTMTQPTGENKKYVYFFTLIGGGGEGSTLNYGTDQNTYQSNASIWLVDSTGTSRQAGVVSSANGTVKEYEWRIQPRTLASASSTGQVQGYTGTTYKGAYTHYIEISVDNIAERDVDLAVTNFKISNGIRFAMGGGPGQTEQFGAYEVTKKAFPTQPPTDTEASKTVYWQYSYVQNKIDVEYSVSAANDIRKDAIYYKYTFRIYLKDADAYKFTLGNKWEPAGRANYNTQLAVSQSYTVKRAALNVTKVTYIHGNDYTSNQQGHIYDGFQHGIKLTFGGFVGGDVTTAGDTIENGSSLINQINNAINCDNGINGSRYTPNEIIWTAFAVNTYRLSWASTAIGKNYTINASSNTYFWAISKYIAKLEWQRDVSVSGTGSWSPWNNGATLKYNATEQKAFRAVISDGNNPTLVLSKESWDYLTSLIIRSLTPGGTGVYIASTYSEGNPYSAVVTFGARNVSSASNNLYTASIGLTANENFTLASETRTFEITPVSISAVATWSDTIPGSGNTGRSAIYNTSHQGVTGISFTGLLSGDNSNLGPLFQITQSPAALTVTAGATSYTVANAIDATSYSVTVERKSANKNYTFTATTYSWTITKRNVTVKPDNSSLTFVYDGKAHALSFKAHVDGGASYSSGGNWNNDRFTISVTYPDGNRNNGICNVNYSNGSVNAWNIDRTKVTFSAMRGSTGSTSNYNVSTEGGSITITQAQLGINWQDLAFVYSGLSQVPTANATGVISPESVTFTVAGAAIDAGEYTAQVTGIASVGGTNAFGATKTTNYYIGEEAQISTAFTINPKEITINFGAGEFTYNGNRQAPELTAIGAVNGEIINISYDKVYGVNAGTYTANVTLGNGNLAGSGIGGVERADGSDGKVENYIITGKTESEFVILPLQIRVNWGETTFVYDALSHLPIATATNIPTGTGITEQVILSVRDSKVNAGRYIGANNAKVYDWTVSGNNVAGETVKGNYTLPASANDYSTDWEITARPLTVKLNARNNVKAYKAYDGINVFAVATNVYSNGSGGEASVLRSNNYRLGQGFTVTGLAAAESNANLIITALFAEAGANRAKFDSFINGVYEKSSNVFETGGKYYKKLVFTKSGASKGNYTFEIEEFSPGQKTGDSVTVFDSSDTEHVKTPEYSLNIAIEKYMLTVTYENLVQSYVTDENMFKTDPTQWSPVSGSTNKPVDITVTNGWINSVYKQYTTVRGAKGNANLGATIQTTADGRYINYDILNQPTLIIGYFIDKDGSEIATLADLMMATYYYKLNFTPGSGSQAVQYKWETMVSMQDYLGNVGIPQRVPDNPTGSPFEGSTWDDYFDAYENWYNSLPEAEKISDISIVLSDDGSEYGYFKPYTYSLQNYLKFVQTDNISGVMTDQDMQILNGQFADGWGYGTENLSNFMFTNVGNNLTVIGAVFNGSFAGEYNGNGYFIDGINIVSTITAKSDIEINVGFFEYLDGEKQLTTVGEDGVAKEITTRGEVKNINIRNLNISVYDYSGTANTINVGALIGYSAAQLTVSQISVHGAIRITAATANVNVGGIIGSDKSALGGALAPDFTVSGGIFTGSINVNGAIVSAGGIIGRAQNGSKIENAVAFAEIYSRGSTSNNSGGVIGTYEGASVSASNIGNILTGTVVYMRNAVINGASGETRNRAVGSQGADDASDSIYCKTYTAIRSGTKTAFNADGFYDGKPTDKGIYDVLNDSTFGGNAKARISLRLGDIIDIYFLQYTVSKENYQIGSEWTGAAFKKASVSWLVGDKIGTDNSRIEVKNIQHVQISRLLRFVSFKLTADVVYYVSSVSAVFEGAFYGSVEANGYKIYLRGGATNLFEYTVPGAIPAGTVVLK